MINKLKTLLLITGVTLVGVATASAATDPMTFKDATGDYDNVAISFWLISMSWPKAHNRVSSLVSWLFTSWMA